mgnify:CR=1 FL=1|jgi:hypothetical protein
MKLSKLMYPGSKWRKYLAMWEDETLRPFLPETARFTRTAFLSMISRHPSVYLKPDMGGGGYGIMRVRPADRGWLLEKPNAIVRFHNRELIYRYLAHKLNRKTYIVQQGVDLIRLRDRPMDFRCLFYKKDGGWHYAGCMGKVAAPRKWTTNLCQGGHAITFEEAMTSSLEMPPEEIEHLREEMQQVALSSVFALERVFPRLCQVGLDIGIDAEKQIRIIEANSRPRFELFRAHEDGTLYQRIRRDLLRLRRLYPLRRSLRARRRRTGNASRTPRRAAIAIRTGRGKSKRA